MVEYYRQRAGAGLNVTEGTSPSPNGVGYPRSPGIRSARQVGDWKKITDAVHAKGGADLRAADAPRAGGPPAEPAGGNLTGHRR